MQRTLVISSLLLCGLAHADAEEWRLAFAGDGAATTVTTGGADAKVYVFGGRVALGYGLTNSLDARAELAFSAMPTLQFKGATISGRTGNLYADLYAAEASAGVAWHPGVRISRLFAATQPLVGLRGGLLLRWLADEQLLTADNQLLLAPGTDLQPIPFLALRVGAEHRFGRGFLVALLVDLAAGSDYSHVGANLEVAWCWY